MNSQRRSMTAIQLTFSLDNTFTGFLAGEAKSPRYSIAHATFLVPIRVTVVYLISIIFIGLLISPTNERLFGGSGVAASPFVIALDEAGIRGLPEFLNVVIMFAVAAIGAESIYVASRILRAMAHQRLIPGWVAHVDSKGRPRAALFMTTLVAIALTYCNLSAGGITGQSPIHYFFSDLEYHTSQFNRIVLTLALVFNWLAQIASTGYFMVWVVIAITSFRFRAALKAQNDPLFSETYAWKTTLWPLPPIWLLICCSLYVGCSIYLALYPIVSVLRVGSAIRNRKLTYTIGTKYSFRLLLFSISFWAAFDCLLWDYL